MSTTWALLVSLVLLAANAFFVAAEFALVASKPHRLEAAAEQGSRAARAALAGSRELSLMLAGAQLGITLCTLGLGALAKPALADLLSPLFGALGMPDAAAYTVAFVLALSVVVFLHMVVGEMMPKSWAITHPEDSALLLALPFRAFARASRWALRGLNACANAILRLIKVEPQDALAHAHGPDELLLLLEASREHGTLPGDQQELLTAMLALQHTSVAQVMTAAVDISCVPATADAHAIEDASRTVGHSRLAVCDDDRSVTGIVHVRDAMRATATGRTTTAAELAAEPLRLPEGTPVATAVRVMREHRAQLAVVTDPDGATVGVVAMEDLLEEIIGEFDDETDPIPQAARPRPPRAT
ncbi:hemolysin family protein [Longispora sp. NPDC051575]|uniref:hemolysin family protein n=1 Tax=Longispora sp. NPDC051575 TaxID=3154943 RepID=UPI003415492E